MTRDGLGALLEKAPATRATGHAAFRIANRFEKSRLAMPTTDAVELGYRASEFPRALRRAFAGSVLMGHLRN